MSSRGMIGPDDDRPLLPEQTADDTDAAWGEPRRDDDDERIWREVPPHHGG